jgi:hypothetical protein
MITLNKTGNLSTVIINSLFKEKFKKRLIKERIGINLTLDKSLEMNALRCYFFH